MRLRMLTTQRSTRHPPHPRMHRRCGRPTVVSAGRIEWQPSLSAAQIDEVLALVARVTELEGRKPVSERVVLQVRHNGAADTRHALLRSDRELVGYAQLNVPESVAELAAVDSVAVRALVDGLVAESGRALRVWAHGQSAASAPVLRDLGFAPQRVLFQMRRSLTEPSLSDPAWPNGVTVRTFVVDQDEAPWLAVNNAAFAEHPEQSNWSIDDIRAREKQPWFDPAGFFLAERAGELVGFHWTKVHNPTLGEVYVVGVDPDEQGSGLGRALTLAGLRHLRDRGVAQAKLYVDDGQRPRDQDVRGPRVHPDHGRRHVPSRSPALTPASGRWLLGASCRGYRAPRRVPRASAAGPRPRPRSAPRRRVLSHQGRRGREHEDPTAWESCSPPALVASPFACARGYVPTLLLRMTHQGHSVTTFTCGFTHPRGNDSGKPPRNCRRSGNSEPQASHRHRNAKSALPVTSPVWTQNRANRDTGSFRLREP